MSSVSSRGWMPPPRRESMERAKVTMGRLVVGCVEEEGVVGGGRRRRVDAVIGPWREPVSVVVEWSVKVLEEVDRMER